MQTEKLSFDKAKQIISEKPENVSFRAFGQAKGENEKTYAASFLSLVPEMVQDLTARRQGRKGKNPEILSFSEYAKERIGVGSMSQMLNLVGIDRNQMTAQEFMTADGIADPTKPMLWLFAEYITDLVNLGARKRALYPKLILDDIPVSSRVIRIPYVTESGDDVKRLNEGESVPMGTLAVGDESVNIYKYGRGLNFTDELRSDTTLSLIEPFVEGLGYKMASVLDRLAVDTIINGGIAEMSMQTVGVKTPNTLTYKDIVKGRIQMSMLGQTVNAILAGRDAGIEVASLDEFTGKNFGGFKQGEAVHEFLDVRNQGNINIYSHAKVPNTVAILLNTANALRKVTARQLMTETDRIVKNQTDLIVVTGVAGFIPILRNAKLGIDYSKDFTAHPFNGFMLSDADETAEIEK